MCVTMIFDFEGAAGREPWRKGLGDTQAEFVKPKIARPGVGQGCRSPGKLGHHLQSGVVAERADHKGGNPYPGELRLTEAQELQRGFPLQPAPAGSAGAGSPVPPRFGHWQPMGRSRAGQPRRSGRSNGRPVSFSAPLQTETPPHSAACRLSRILRCRDGPLHESLARSVNDVIWETVVEGLDGRGARQDTRPERCTHRERGFDNRQLSHGESHGEGVQHAVRHRGVLHQGEDHTVRWPGLVRRGVMVSWPRQSRKMMDQMGARGRDQPAEPQHGPERRELPAAPVGPWQERSWLPSVVCSRSVHWRGLGRPHHVPKW
jgi:hypothetical protein